MKDNNEQIEHIHEEEVNRKNREQYEELIKNSKTKTDMYFDKNSIVTKIVLGLLGTIIIIGVVYYIFVFLSQIR